MNLTDITPLLASVETAAAVVIGCVLLAALVYVIASFAIRSAHDRDDQRSAGPR